MKESKYVVFAALVAALGGLLFGFDTAVISGTTHWLQEIFKLSSFWLGFTVASALIGTIIGAIIVGKPSDRYGRRSILFILAIFYFVSAVGTALAWEWFSFLVFRFLGGLAVGGASVVSPMYIAEISPAKYRGRLVAVTQFNIVLGILLAFFSNYLISGLNLGQVEWRWMFGVEAIPAAAFFFLLFSNPRSPRWLIAKGYLEEARTVLTKCGTDSGNIDEEVREIQASLDVEHHSLKEPFFNRKYLKPILLAVAIAMFNQLSGINALMYYAPHIFKMAGAAAESALLQTVAVGGTNLILTMAALLVIDNFGRKKLMLAGSTVVLIGLLVFIASHAFGQGAVIWVFISEIFPNRVRARGQALGSFTHWFMAAAISWTFPMIAEVSGGHTFAFYTICMVGQLFWVLMVMPETKGISLEQIQKKLGIE
jgi:sugar porter (SP) family MFS transporter